jgi:hypothetical protein
MHFPWDTSVNLSFTCQFCGDTRWVTNGMLAECTCAEARQAQYEARSSAAVIMAARAAEQPTFWDIRQQRKLRSRHKK